MASGHVLHQNEVILVIITGFPGGPPPPPPLPLKLVTLFSETLWLYGTLRN